MPSLPVVEHTLPLAARTDRLIAQSAHRLGSKHLALWRGEPITRVERVKLVSLNRLGGQPGYSGSQLFVVALRGKTTRGRAIDSQPLLLKLVEDNPTTAENLRDEIARYNSVRHRLPPRAHAKPIDTTPSIRKRSPTQLIWSDFIDEQTVGGLPQGPPTELRHILEAGRWSEAIDCVRAAYKVLATAHTGAFDKICYYDHYEEYLRISKGWVDRLRASIGDSELVQVFGQPIANPLKLIDEIQLRPAATTGIAHLSAVHGDLHPKNVLVGDVSKACLIDFGWSRSKFHTIVDFVFMEASLKFFRLPWHVPRSELLLLEHQLSSAFLPDGPPTESPIRKPFELIRALRESASKFIDPTEPNWFERQYLLPLFLVTSGLFSYPSTITNMEHLLLSSGLLASRVRSSLV